MFLKKLSRYLLIIFLAYFAVTCIPPLEGPPPDPRSFDIPSTDLNDLSNTLPYFEDFVYAMQITHLNSLLKEGPYTIFAPVQSSFSNFRMRNNISHLDHIPKDKLSQILRYHIVPGNWSLADFPEGYHSTVALEKTTGNPISILIEKYDVFRINGRYLIDTPDLPAVNGFIHSIGIVLEIPDLMDHLSYNKDFSLLIKILERKDLDQELIGHLSNADPVTFFAPTNKAIISFLNDHPLWEAVHDIPKESLDEILRNHIILNRNIVLNNMKKDNTLVAESEVEFTIRIDYPEWSILGTNGKLANLSVRDIQAYNGIIQQIDRVLN